MDHDGVCSPSPGFTGGVSWLGISSMQRDRPVEGRAEKAWVNVGANQSMDVAALPNGSLCLFHPACGLPSTSRPGLHSPLPARLARGAGRLSSVSSA